MHDALQLLPLVGFFLLIGAAGLLLLRWERRQADTWTAVAEGEFERVEYSHYTYARRSGSMVHTTSYHRMDVTAVFFRDGRSFKMNGRHDVPHPPGTKLRLWRNGLGGHRLEFLA